MGIFLCSRNMLMAHNDLCHTDIHAGFNQIGTKGMPQIMEIKIHSNFCLHLFQLVIGSGVGKLLSKLLFLLRKKQLLTELLFD